MSTLLSQKTREYINILIHARKKQEAQAKSEVPVIHVDYIASKIALLYEKIRQVIDYREEHLLRTNAITRILQRKFLFSGELSDAQGLTEELIRGGYFTNDSIPQSQIGELETILKKYTPLLGGDESLRSWLYEIAACEIEEELAHPVEELALTNFMVSAMEERIHIEQLSEQEKHLFLLVAVHQTLLYAHSSLIHWRLLKLLYPQWRQVPQNEEWVRTFQEQLPKVKQYFDELERHPWTRKFRDVCRRKRALFIIIHDMAREDPTEFESLVENSELFETKILEVYQKRTIKLNAKLARAGFRSVLSIFLSKIAVALAIEVPFDLYVAHSFLWSAFFANVAIPPLLMLMIFITTRLPSERNAELILFELSHIIRTSQQHDILLNTVSHKRRVFLQSFVVFFYFVTFIVSLGGIVFLLRKFGFSTLSVGVFILFVSLIAFSGHRLRSWAKELSVEEEREGFFVFLLDIFALPILKLGKILTAELQRFNFLIIALNLLFEAPIQSIVAFVEEWRRFVREKKEEL